MTNFLQDLLLASNNQDLPLWPLLLVSALAAGMILSRRHRD